MSTPTSRVTVHIQQDGAWTTAPATGIKFTRQVPGGMVSASFRLPDTPQWRRLRTDARCHITSATTTQVLWQGHVADPHGVTVDGSASILTQSYSRRPYVVAELSAWDRDDQKQSVAAGTMNVTTVDVNPPYPAEVLQVPQGTTIAANGATRLRIRSYAYDGTVYYCGAFHLKHAEAVASDRWRTFAVIGPDTGTNRLFQAPWDNTPGEAIYARGVSPGFNAPHPLVTVGLETTAYLDYFTADESRWSAWPILTTIAQLRKRSGAHVNPMPQRSTLYAWEVVEDIIGRDLLGLVSTAQVDTIVNQTAGEPIDSLYYDTPVTAAKVLDDLVEHMLGDFYYAVWPSTSAMGQVGLWWMPWSDRPRYLLPPERTEVQVTGSDEGLCNRVVVAWSDQYGKRRTTSLTSTPEQYPDLADVGTWDAINGWSRIVEAPPIDLGEGRSSAAMATQVAAAYARQVATRPRAGKATVGKDVLDLYTGQICPPEEIMPGYLAWSTELQASLRVTSTEYDEDTQTCTMLLDSPRSTIDQLIARALRATTKGRR
ncbi:hypothetical protein [Calidifontibacter indicus]|uniref:hypothetical protein n=1 Tax=Calidifontibacter indicus TaxID=419650 RepID=UPI003D7107AC